MEGSLRTDPADETTPRPQPPLPARDWALFFDVDGCLLDFAAHPSDVIVPEGLQRHILQLAEALDGALAIVSGRAIDALDETFPELTHLPAAGMHGLERREIHGQRTHAPQAPAALDTVLAEAIHVSSAYPGTMVERKGPNLAMHWRAATMPELARDAFRAFAAATSRLLPEYVVQAGDMVLELRPGGVTPDKGDAVETFLMAPPFAGRVPVFVGDDLTDEHAFSVVNQRGGLSVLVGAREPSVARWHLRDPASVRAWIARAASRDGATA
jgi:trehalose 6-phosphate phosphatase